MYISVLLKDKMCHDSGLELLHLPDEVDPEIVRGNAWRIDVPL